MKCLLILPRPVFPLVCGYALKNYNLIQILANKYKLHLVIIADKELKEEEITYYQSLSVQLTVHRIPKWKSYANSFLGIFSTKPLQVCYYYDKSLQEKIKHDLQNCDILIGALVRTRAYLDEVEKTPGKVIVFDMVDSIALNYQRSKNKTKSWFWKILYEIEGKRLFQYEKKWVENSSVTYLFNQEEQAYWSQYGNVKWLPHGVNEKLFTYGKRDEKWEDSVVFMGKMDYQPNVDAALWYMEHVHKHIGDKIPLIIVGAYPTESILSWAQKLPNVTVTGYVDDPYLYVNSAMAVIAPMQTGGGIQNKVLEGMALGKINVISSLAAKPIVGGVNGVHFLVADGPEEYVETLMGIRNDRERYQVLGALAQQLIVDRFTWEQYGNEYVKALRGKTSPSNSVGSGTK